MHSTGSLRPSSGTKTARVWEIADEITHKFGRLARRQEVIDQFSKEGGNPNTASTQYSQWHSAIKSMHKTSQNQNIQNIRTQAIIGADGRILIPLEIRNALNFSNNKLLNLIIKNGELIISPPKSALNNLRNLIASTDKNDISIVEELIAERRREFE